MAGNERRAIPRQTGVCITVQMNHVGTQTTREMQQPVAGSSHIRFALRHPLEFVVTLEEGVIGTLTYSDLRSVSVVNNSCCYHGFGDTI